MTNTEKNLLQYRVRRVDPRNLAIERQVNGKWVNAGYFGNNLDAVGRGLGELVVSELEPDLARPLGEQIRKLRREFREGIERMIRVLGEMSDLQKS